MSDKSTPLVSPEEQSRDRLRLLLTVCCALAILLAATLVPAVSTADLGRSPLGSLVPQPSVQPFGQSGDGGQSGGLGDGGRLGALNPGSRTGVGGSLAGANDSSAFRSRNAETHFTVRSSVASYWRTGAYDTYTGDGWKRTGGRKPYAGPLTDGGIPGRRVRYRVTLDRPATALPSVWRATSLSRPSSADLYVTDQRAFETDESVPAGTTYTGVSHVPPRDPAVLRAAGRDYPDRIRSEYTQLPAETDRRLGRFTRNLTRDATSPYETAVRVESWLESNKRYSLNVSQPPDGDVASQFVFEMDAGYCEYFATAMTAMLRSQGVPARYVVGYSTGQRVGENAYRVRGLNAHAWVEVYFPDVGWVRFDPTPGAERLRSERRAFERQRDRGTYSPTERGSPNETFSANGSVESPSAPGTSGTSSVSGTPSASGTPSTSGPRPTASGTSRPRDATTSATGPETSPATTATTLSTTTSTRSSPSTTTPNASRDETTDRSTPSTRIELNRTPVPGATVTVSVVRSGSPVTGETVRFNGRAVGTTDADGRVVARVPYARNLTITVGGTATSPTNARVGLPPLGSGIVAAAADPPPLLIQDASANRSANGSASYSLATNVTLTVSGDAVTGNTVVVTATIRGVPVRDALVRLNDRRVGRTDARGRIRVRLPESPGNVSLTASRGPATGERTLTLPTLAVSAEPTLPLALPGGSVEVSASYGDDPVAGVPVRVAGRRVGTTGVDGTLTASLPFANDARIEVARDGQTRRTTVSGLLVNLGGVLVGLGVVVGGIVVVARRRGISLRSLAARVASVLRRAPALLVAGLFAAVDLVERALIRADRRLRAVLASLAALYCGDLTRAEALERLREWFASRFDWIRARLAVTRSPGASAA
ncbi:transglutaminaseTgpA domain-containing protein, partial [Halorussus sp. GCM10023401]